MSSGPVWPSLSQNILMSFNFLFREYSGSVLVSLGLSQEVGSMGTGQARKYIIKAMKRNKILLEILFIFFT